MNLALTNRHRDRADQLILATAKDGASATETLLRHFPPDVWPALIAYLARIACEARRLPCDATAWKRGQPEHFTTAQRREARRLYGLGVRTSEVIAGKREYDRVWARENRAG